MIDTAAASGGRPGWFLRHAEVILATLLGLTAFLGAAGAYRQSLEDGNATLALSRAGQLRTAATADLAQANQNLTADLSVFLQYTQAARTGQPAYAEYVQTHLMDVNLRTAVAWWEAHPTAASPFVRQSPYVEPLYAKANERNEAADANMTAYEEYDGRSLGLQKAVALLAVCLFLFGMAAVVSTPRIRIGATAIGLAVLTLAIISLFVTHAI